MSEQFSNIQLYGRDPVEGIVGLQLLNDDPQSQEAWMRTYFRDEGGIRFEDDRLYPFFYLNDITLMSAFPESLYKWKELKGSGYYKYIVVFESWRTMWQAVSEVREQCRNRGWVPVDERDKYPKQIYLIRNPEQQYLTQRGRTFFKGLDYNDVTRFRLDIETYSPRDAFPNPERATDEIIIITVSNNRGMQATLYQDRPDVVESEVPNGIACDGEEGLLKTLIDMINEDDPDVIEGHNLYAYDLPYIFTRCKRHGISFAIGRDKTEPETYESSKRFAERDISYTHFNIAGRSILDTFFEVMQYDVFSRSLPGYGLKEVAKFFDFAPEGRTYVEGDKISWHWDNDPMPLLAYASDDTYETGKLSDHLGGSGFYLAQIIPMDYQKSLLAGTATKIESLLVREYLRMRHSMPTYEAGRQEVGGYTDIYMTGVFNNVIYADVASLYPSIMLHYDVHPEGDDLGLFRSLLQNLTDLRFWAKGKMKEQEDPQKRQLFDAMQNSFKTLINSFYGQLGYSRAIFNDFSEADRVTVIGQSLLRRMVKLITEDGGRVIEVDTDGVLTQAPGFVYTEGDKLDADRAFQFMLDNPEYRHKAGWRIAFERDEKMVVDDVTYVKDLTSRMPDGIKIDFDGRAVRMLSYKKKNYGLREPGKTKTKLKGGSLISRLYEPFGKDFMREVVDALMDREPRRVHETYVKYWKMIVTHDWTPELFRKKATLKDPIEVYLKKIEKGSGKGGRNRAAAYELAIQHWKDTGLKPEPGDRVGYYVAGDAKAYKVRAFEDAKREDAWDPENPDENTEWYLDRLKNFAKKFRKFFTPKDFKMIFDEKTIADEIDWSQVKLQEKKVVRKEIPTIIAGSRNITDMFFVERAIAGCPQLKTIQDKDDTGYRIGEVISGTAKGVDSLGERWAEENGIPVKKFPADWDGLGKRAGFVRNGEMAEYASRKKEEGIPGLLIAIWDGKSKGTADMIRQAKNAGMMIHISHPV